jgi:CheY-like chemotaxis protein
MAARKVLSVGQCGVDQAAIARQLRQRFDVEVVDVDSIEEAFEALRRDQFDLVLANRVFDRGGSGLDFISALKADESLKGVPAMLVSDLPEAQRQAERLGALPGFGKGALDHSETTARLAALLDGQASNS